jgi:ribosome-associated toxin RatA of RatAB toxin-antitoxin module
MTKIEFDKTLPYAAQDLFNLVMDIKNYPAMFPFIDRVIVAAKQNNKTRAKIWVTTPIMNFDYDCEITVSAPKTPREVFQIDIRATRGPFKSMDAKWVFAPQTDGTTKVHYEMSYDVGGFGLRNLIAGPFIKSQVDATITAFENYAIKTLKTIAPIAPRPAPL